ncbi:MAG: phospho-2-dehydro-3-deoxyheptonate aldolase [Parcubacteria group bacterium Gr01-1014_8]|nr:MAG: phospho-2-dehydro-3-deoxyheptonate aldolase [Parcubacteria group bacterium Gr01-1014_8]
MQKKELESLRKEIDTVDTIILSALAKRAKLSKVIGKYKLEKGMRALDKTRKTQLIKSRIAMAKAMKISTKLANEIFSRIHKNSVAIQKNIKL